MFPVAFLTGVGIIAAVQIPEEISSGAVTGIVVAIVAGLGTVFGLMVYNQRPKKSLVMSYNKSSYQEQEEEEAKHSTNELELSAKFAA